MAGRYSPSFWQKHRGKIGGIIVGIGTFIFCALIGAVCILAIGIPVAFALSFIMAIVVVTAISLSVALLIGKAVSLCCETSADDFTPVRSSSKSHLAMNQAATSMITAARSSTAKSSTTTLLSSSSAPSTPISSLATAKPSHPDDYISWINLADSDEERRRENKYFNSFAEIFMGICAGKEVYDSICRLHQLDNMYNNGLIMVRDLRTQGAFTTITGLKLFLERFHLHGLVNIYLSPPQENPKEIKTIYNETEKKVESLFEAIPAEELKAVRSMLKNFIDCLDWRVLLHELINEGKIKIDDETVPSMRALLTECGLAKHLPPQPSVEIQTPASEPVPPQATM